MENSTSHTSNVKLNIIGSGGTGKTRYIITIGSKINEKGYQVENLTPWNEELVSTVGGYFLNLHNYKINDESSNDFAIWDLGGQLRYSDVRKVYLEDTSGIMAVIDLSRGFSLQVLKEAMFKEEVSKVCDENIPIVLVGNKSDLRKAIQKSKKEIAKIIFTAIDQIIETRRTSYEIGIRIGPEKGVKSFESSLNMLGDRPALKVADFEASVFYSLKENFTESNTDPFTEMNLKLLARELWFVITNSLFLGMMGEKIPYSLVERASLGVPLFREYMRSPDVLVPIDFGENEIEDFLEEILVSTERLNQLADELKEHGYNVVYVGEVSAIEEENVMDPFKTLLNTASIFRKSQNIKEEPESEKDLEKDFEEF